MRTAAVAIALFVASCGSYGAGAFSARGVAFVGRRVQLRCLDVSVAPTGDARAEGLLLAFTFGNHCNEPAIVDFSSIDAVGRYADGTRALRAYDPQHELRPLRLAGGDVGHEIIAYQGPDGGAPTAACVDLGTFERRAEASTHWVCFGAWDLGASPPFVGVGAAPSTNAANAAATGRPLPAEPDPLVAAIPLASERDVASVGAYFAARIADRRLLVKALHDYVIRRLRYDDDAHRPGRPRPAQDADAVFARRLALCEGYANLLTALGRAAGVPIEKIDGRAVGGDTGGNHAHAWNAARLDEGWVLIDATWDGADPDHPSTQYLMTSPAVFAREHEPDDHAWLFVTPELALDDLAIEPSRAVAR